MKPFMEKPRPGMERPDHAVLGRGDDRLDQGAAQRDGRHERRPGQCACQLSWTTGGDIAHEQHEEVQEPPHAEPGAAMC